MTVASTTEVQDVEDGRLFAKQCESWTANVRIIVAKQRFKKQQFITNDASERDGSRWMLGVCDGVGIPVRTRSVFWERSGRKAANKALGRRRQNATNQMKKLFGGKWITQLLFCCPIAHY